MKVSYLSTFSSWLLLENRRGFSVRKKQKNRNCLNRGTVLVGVIETESFFRVKTFLKMPWLNEQSIGMHPLRKRNKGVKKRKRKEFE